MQRECRSTSRECSRKASTIMDTQEDMQERQERLTNEARVSLVTDTIPKNLPLEL